MSTEYRREIFHVSIKSGALASTRIILQEIDSESTLDGQAAMYIITSPVGSALYAIYTSRG